MHRLGLGDQHAPVARRYRLMALLIVGMIDTTGCHAGLHLAAEAGVAPDGGDSEGQNPSNTQGSVGGSAPSKTSPYQFCPCANTPVDLPVLAKPSPGASSDKGRDLSDLFTSVSMGSNYDTGCGVRTNQTIACWGAGLDPYNPPPEGLFSSVSVGPRFSCGVRIDGTLACWGRDPPEPPSGTFLSVSVSDGYGTTVSGACAVRTNATLACWAATPNHLLVPPPGTFTSVSVGSKIACAVKMDGTLACWRKDGQVAPPTGPFISVSVGSDGLCGVKTDGTIACHVLRSQGSCNDTEDVCVWSRPPQGRFISVSAGLYSGCGITVDGTLACWGMFSSFVLAGPFTSVSAGQDGGVCAIRTDGTLLCWVYEHGGGAGGPGGGF